MKPQEFDLCNAPNREGSISKDRSVLIQTIERLLEVGEGRELRIWWRGAARAEGGLEVVEIWGKGTVYFPFLKA